MDSRSKFKGQLSCSNGSQELKYGMGCRRHGNAPAQTSPPIARVYQARCGSLKQPGNIETSPGTKKDELCGDAVRVDSRGPQLGEDG